LRRLDDLEGLPTVGVDGTEAEELGTEEARRGNDGGGGGSGTLGSSAFTLTTGDMLLTLMLSLMFSLMLLH